MGRIVRRVATMDAKTSRLAMVSVTFVRVVTRLKACVVKIR